MVRALELFAGIGGEALALRALGIHTAAYCECDPFCQAVLLSNMARGRLDAAPIFPDVAELSGADVKRVDMIAAGFPCKGLSSAGKRRGLYGDHRSALVLHVCRLVDELEPNYVFLENTPLIIRDPGFPKLLRSFAPFRCAFVVSSASQEGAAHQRYRFFLLAARKGAPPLRLAPGGVDKLRGYLQQRIKDKVEPREFQRAKRTCAVYGNSVVPAQAAAALTRLNAALADDGALEPTSLAALNRRLPTLVVDGAMYQDPRQPTPDARCRGPGFSVVPRGLRGGSPRTPRVLADFWTLCMPTPRTGANCAVSGRSMTKRTTRDAGTLLLASKEMYADGEVPKDARGLAVSACFWSAHMGFPKDWISKALAG
jgi:hypothetical protein